MDEAAQLYIVEDHPVVREALCDLLGSVPGFAVCGAAGSGEAALEDPAVLGADVVLVDMSLPGMNGAAFVSALREKKPALRCLMLSAHGGAGYIRQARSAGACGYVIKNRPAEVVRALRQVIDEGARVGIENVSWMVGSA